MFVPTRPYQDRIGPRLRDRRSRQKKQTGTGLYKLYKIKKHPKVKKIKLAMPRLHVIYRSYPR
jgi:hypothetical protein